MWKETLQTKLKILRSKNLDKAEVKHHQAKYARAGSGRPVKEHIGEIAKRDNQKKVINHNNIIC